MYNLMHIVYISWCFFTAFSLLVSSFFMKTEIYFFFSISIFEISFLVDFLSIVFFNTLMIIVTSVFFFSKEYMSSEVLMFRFLFFTIMFISSMIFFIFGSSIFTLLIGWDGLGVTSFFLVLFFQNASSWSASMKTALTNRLGDGFLIIVFGALLLSNNTFIEKMFNIPLVFVLFLILGSFTKSAQFPFSNWLPAAMAAPTPISSLVHSSTLVTAGVFLIIRFSSFFLDFYFLKMTVMASGIITMLFAGSIALLEKDLKKVVALSTLSHLGLMMMSCSMIGPLFAFFHLIMHAIFKALLFINMGYLIISSNHNQDSRLLSLNSSYLTMSVLFSLFSMMGFYFFNGFLSKDLIIFLSLSHDHKNIVMLALLCLGFCLTVSYSMRFFFSLFCYFKNIQISLSKTLFKSTLALLMMCLMSGDLVKSMMLENFMFFHAEKMSFFIPLIVIAFGCFFYKMASSLQSVSFVESMFFLNFILGNWTVFISNFFSFKMNSEVNNTVNVLLENKITNSSIQNFSNSLIYYFFFLILLVFWLSFFMKILSSYSL